MSAATLEIVRGIRQAAADGYDGALDDDGKPIEIGLKREKGHPVLDSRTMDGFKVRVDGTHLIVSYQADIKLKDVYSGNFENEVNQTIEDVVKFLKKRYKKITNNTLSLKAVEDADMIVQSTSRVRVFVNATKKYKIKGMDGVEDRLDPSKEKLESNFKDFLEAGGWKGQRPSNDTRKKE